MWKWLKWKLKGSPYITYEGFYCGCCGAWEKKTITIKTYQSLGERWDTVGLCNCCTYVIDNGLERRWLMGRQKKGELAWLFSD